MSKRKSLPTKISLTSSDEEAIKKNESDLEEDNGVFEEDTIATELNSDLEESDQLNNNRLDKKQLEKLDKSSSAMLNNLMSNKMKRKHKKFRPSDADDNLDYASNNLNNGNNLNSLMNLAIGNNPSAVDLFALSLQSMDNEQLISTMARLTNANALNEQIKDNQQLTKNNNGIFRRRKRSELEDDDENEQRDEENTKANLTANLLAALNQQQQQLTNNNLNEQLTIEAQLSKVRKQLPDNNEAKQDAERRLKDMFKQINELQEKLKQQTEVQQNGNSLVNGSAFNTNLSLDIVS